MNALRFEPPSDEFRRGMLTGFGADDAVAAELLAVNANRRAQQALPPPARFPLDDEPQLEAWREYAEEAQTVGAWRALRGRLAQLRFPIRAGISQEDAYRQATLKGMGPEGESGVALRLRDPGAFELLLNSSLAGTVPILVAGSRADFEMLVQAFTARNEPKPVPASMGACLVAGVNNWDRIRTYRARWEAVDPQAHTAEAWGDEFRQLAARKELYQDRFIVLSRGPYSNVAAGDLGLAEAEWLALSLAIRREHECTHYFTLRVFGSLGHNVLEELIADYVGIVRAVDSFRADWALRFLGVDTLPAVREGGRLHVYRGQPPVSDAALAVQARLLAAGVRNLARWHQAHPASSAEALAPLVFALTTLTLEELAAEDMPERVARCLAGLSAPGA